METRFTPGPWSNDSSVSFHDSELPCVLDAHYLVVAECSDDGHSLEECEANANLIAAAPALYEALERCRARLLVVGMIGTKDEIALNLSHAALALARGEHPESRVGLDPDAGTREHGDKA